MSDTPNEEHVVLLDAQGQSIGSSPKASVHTADTPLHSAFSIFLFDGEGQMLVQQRALSKKTWAGVWSNACCGHPAPGESHIDAAHRRLREELAITGIRLEMILPDFQYQATWKGITENEICPVFVGFCASSIRIHPNPLEVEAVKWISWKSFSDTSISKVENEYSEFSPWSHMEAQLLRKSSRFEKALVEFESSPYKIAN